MTYTKEVMEHFQNPKNVGEIKDADAVGKVGNPSCGDVMELSIKIEDNIIKDIKFKTYGCAAAIACSDMVCELAKGKTVEEALKLTKDDVVKELGELPQVKVHCSILGIDALKEALKNIKK